MNVRRMKDGWKEAGPTAVIEHGANPGLISHFTKHALLDIGERILDDKKAVGAAADEIKQQLADRAFNLLAMKLGVKVIHCSERDTQISDKPKQVDEFVNTWSVEGFREEGTTTAEMGWGTHEKELPPRAYEHQEGPRNQICMAQMGIEHLGADVGAELFDPRHGRPPRRGVHDLRRLTVWEHGRPPIARRCTMPTVPVTLRSRRSTNCAATTMSCSRGLRIMNDEITSGADILGALLMGHPTTRGGAAAI